MVRLLSTARHIRFRKVLSLFYLRNTVIAIRVVIRVCLSSCLSSVHCILCSTFIHCKSHGDSEELIYIPDRGQCVLTRNL